MKKHAIRHVQVIRTVDEPVRLRRNDIAIVEVQKRWAPAVAALVKLAVEYRDAGLLVTNVGPGSGAALVGIARGDVLLRCDGVPLDSPESLKRLTRRSGGSGRNLTVEAMRGTREMTFEVAAGPLGITVSPQLHRSASRRRPVHRSAHREGHVAADRSAGGHGAGGHKQMPLDETTLVEVPGHLVPQVRLLKHMMETPANGKQRKDVEALLVTASRLLPVRMAIRHADEPKPPSSPPPSPPARAPSSPKSP